MELFKKDTLKKMYENFTQKTIFQIFNCKYCSQKYCRKHYRFDCSCNQCREAKCYNCHRFNVELESLMTSCSKEARLYILNYVRDFFSVNSITLKFFFNFEKQCDIDSEKLQNIIWDLNLYHGTKKGRQVERLIETTNYAYTIGNRKFIFRR